MQAQADSQIAHESSIERQDTVTVMRSKQILLPALRRLRTVSRVSALALAFAFAPPAVSAQASLVDDPTLQNWSQEEMDAELEQMRAERRAMSDKDRQEKRHEWTGSMTEEKPWMRRLSEEQVKELMMMSVPERSKALFEIRLSREKGDPVERALDHTFGTHRSLGLPPPRIPPQMAQSRSGGADATTVPGFDNDSSGFQGGPDARSNGQRPPRGGQLSQEDRARLKGMSKAERRAFMRDRLRNRWGSMSEEERNQFRQRAGENLQSMNPQKRAALAERIKERLSRMTPQQREEYLAKFYQRLEGMSQKDQEMFKALLPR
ncbi:MAG: hypothetical protein Alpg2KO_12240 [Alphaproteobacteria bacterium]